MYRVPCLSKKNTFLLVLSGFTILCLWFLGFSHWASEYVYGYPGDLFGYIHFAWWKRFALIEGLNPYFNSLMNFPIGFRYGFPSHPTIAYPLSFLPPLFGEIRAYNILFFTFFLLNFLIPFLILRRLLGKLPPAGLSAFFIAFSQFALWHGMQNIEVFFVAPLVLFIWLLFRFCDAPTLKRAFLLAAAFAFGTLSFFQYGYFLALLLVLFVLVAVVRSSSQRFDEVGLVRMLVLSLVACMVAGVLTLPWTWEIGKGYFFPEKISEPFIAENLTRNTIYDLVAYGARPWDYFMPSIFHPLFGEWIKNFYHFINNHHNFTFHSTFLPERANFIPPIVWVLALIGCVKGFKDQRYRKFIIKTLIGLVFSFWLSLPAFMYVRGIKIYGLSFFLFKLFPMFRVYARAGILVLIFAVFLAGVGLKYVFDFIEERDAPRWLSSAVFVLLFGWGMFENLSLPPLHIVNVAQRPPMYEWLAQQPDNVVIVEYPRDTTDLGGGCDENFEESNFRDYPPSYELLFQRIHHKAFIDYRQMSDENRLIASDLANFETPQILAKHGVHYVLWHTKDYFPQLNPMDPCQAFRYGTVPNQMAEGLEKVAEFEDGIVYRINL